MVALLAHLHYAGHGSREIITELTEAMHRVTGAPIDRITVFIAEIPRSQWGEGGITGDNPDFAALSRRSTKAAAKSQPADANRQA